MRRPTLDTADGWRDHAMTQKPLVLVLAAAVLGFGATRAAHTSDAGPIYRPMGIGVLSAANPLDPTVPSLAEAMNDLGDVVGASRVDAKTVHAFAWRDRNRNGRSDAGEMADLGDLGGDSVHHESSAWAVSRSGRCVAGYSLKPDGLACAFRWNDVNDNHSVDPGESTEIPSPDADRRSYATGVNDAGDVCGYDVLPDDQLRDVKNPRAFLWRDLDLDNLVDPGERVQIGNLGYPGTFDCAAYGINNADQVVGTSFDAGGRRSGFLFQDLDGDHQEETGETAALFWPAAPGAGSDALGISENGHVVGSVGDIRYIAARWSDSDGDGRADTGGFYNLETAASVLSYASKVNSHGDAVGWAGDYASGWHPALFQGGDVIPLDSFVPPGWYFASAGIDLDDAGRLACTGGYMGYEAAQGFILFPGAPATSLRTLTVTPTTVIGGDSAAVKATLTQVVPYDCVVSITNTVPGTTLEGHPYALRIPAGSIGVTAALRTIALALPVKGTIEGVMGDTTLAARVTVRPIGVGRIVVAPASVIGGGGRTSTGKVTLERPAAPREVTVFLSSGDAAASPAVDRIVIPQGSDGSDGSGSFTLNTSYVTQNTSAVIQATARGIAKKTTLRVLPVTVKSIRLTPPSVVGAPDLTAESAGQVLLSAPAPPGGVTVAVESTKPGAAVPSVTSLFIPEGSDGSGGPGAFTVDALPVPVQVAAAIRARLHGYTASSTLTVKPISVGTLTLTPRSLQGGGVVEGVAVLNARAPAGGLVVTLTSSHPGVAAITDGAGNPIDRLTIPEGSDGADGSGRFRVATSAVTASKTVTIKAVANGIARSNTLTVKP
jgi:probable HAF family extracellular repeat protein